MLCHETGIRPLANSGAGSASTFPPQGTSLVVRHTGQRVQANVGSCTKLRKGNSNLDRRCHQSTNRWPWLEVGILWQSPQLLHRWDSNWTNHWRWIHVLEACGGPKREGARFVGPFEQPGDYYGRHVATVFSDFLTKWAPELLDMWMRIPAYSVISVLS